LNPLIARSSKTRKKLPPPKIPSGFITKSAGVFSSVFFSSSPGRFARFFFNHVFGRFVTRGVQKRDKKNRGSS
jgi:hypothetical protein